MSVEQKQKILKYELQARTSIGRYFNNLQPDLDCQDRANRHLYQVEEAMNNQENYLRLLVP